MEQNKNYKDMTMEEFVTDILKIELSENQRHLIRLFEENKGKTSNYYYNAPNCTIRAMDITDINDIRDNIKTIPTKVTY